MLRNAAGSVLGTNVCLEQAPPVHPVCGSTEPDAQSTRSKLAEAMPLKLVRQNGGYVLARGPPDGSEPVTIKLWPDTGKLIGLGRSLTYEAAKRGEIPVLRFGNLCKVPVSALLRMLETGVQPGVRRR